MRVRRCRRGSARDSIYARAYHATPTSLIDDDHHLDIGPRRVIRLRRELVLPLGLFVRNAQYFPHEPSTLHGRLADRGSERQRLDLLDLVRCSPAVHRVGTNGKTCPTLLRDTRERGVVRLSWRTNINYRLARQPEHAEP